MTTNYDKIKAMSVEEMAERLMSRSFIGCPYLIDVNDMIDWLNREAE